jgi:hypothetical protein
MLTRFNRMSKKLPENIMHIPSSMTAENARFGQ